MRSFSGTFVLPSSLVMISVWDIPGRVYSRFREAAAPKQEKKPPRKKGTPEREKQLRRAEREIGKLEERIKELDAEAEANAADYQRLMAIGEERSELSGQLDALYEEWEALSEEE